MSKTAAHILILEDDPDVAFAAEMLLRRRFARVQVLHDPARLDAVLAQGVPDLILLDFNFAPGRIDGTQGLALLDRLRSLPQSPALIAMTAYADVPLAVEALKRGAGDFITKPWDNARLLAAIEQALARRTPASSSTGSPLMGDSAPMRSLKAMIASVGPTNANVMILGENGVGKELVARAIHQVSTRAANTLLAVDMGALPESTFESELFGHRKGSFTDAKTDRPGRFQAARGGSLFLDEIGNMPLAAQAKLLTVLERREVTPLGADKAEPIDVRIISATNLEEVRLFDPAVFRADLLFRLNTIVLRVPPLRERREDIPALLAHYLAHYQQQYQRPSRELAPDALARLCAAPWPGNVRALRHACERAVILAPGEQYQWQDFGLMAPEAGQQSLPPAQAVAIGQTGASHAPGSITAMPGSVTASAAAVVDVHAAPAVSQGEAARADPLSLEALERDAVQSAMQQAQGNISHAAKLLGISRAALYRKLERHGI